MNRSAAYILNLRHLIRRFAGEVSWVILSQAIIVIGTLISLKAFSTLLGIAEFGYYAIAAAVAAAVQLLFNPVSNALLRFYSMAMETSDEGRYLPALAWLRNRALVLSAIAVALVIIGGFLLSSPSDTTIWVLAVLLGITTGLQNWYQTVLLAMRSRRAIALYNFASYVVRPALAALLILWWGPTATNVLIGMILCQLAVLVAQAVQTTRALQGRHNQESAPQDHNPTDLVGRMIHYSSYFWLNALLAALSLQSDRWIVGVLGTPHDIGIYASMIMIATFPVTLIESLANQFLVPVIFERVGRGNADQVQSGRRILGILLTVMSAMMLVTLTVSALWSEQIITLMTDAAFATNSYLLPMLVLGLSLERLGQTLNIQGFIALQTWPYMLARLAHGVTLVGLGLLLTTRIGIDGIAYAHIAAGLLYVSLVLFTNLRLLKR